MDIRDFFQPIYEMRGSPAFQGWLHKSGKMITGGFDRSHGDMIRENWKEMGIPYEIAKDAEDDYSGPAQVAAYSQGWMRFYTSSKKTNDVLYISATPRQYRELTGKILAFIREVNPAHVVLDVLDFEGYPEYVHGRQFVAGDTRGMRSWMQNPETSYEDERW